MKTIKLSLNALVVVCCSLLFMTGCQDDAVENDVLATHSNKNATLTSIPADVEQLLHARLDNPSLNIASITSRTANSNFVYDLAITVFGIDASGSATEALGEIEGTLRLQKLGDTLGVTPLEGAFEYVDESGQQRGRRVAAVITGRTLNIAINNLPIVRNRAFFAVENNEPFSENSLLGEDFIVEGDTIFEELSDVPKFLIRVEGDFVRGPKDTDEPEEEIVPNYELVIETPAEAGGLTLSGTLALAPSERFDDIFSGSFTYVTDSGEEGTLSATTLVGNDNILVIDLEDFQIGFGYINVPDGTFEGGIDNFAANGRLDRSSILFKTTFDLIENLS